MLTVPVDFRIGRIKKVTSPRHAHIQNSGFLADKLCHGLAMAFWIQRLKTFRSNHADHVLVGEPSNLSIAGEQQGHGG